jgi:hypothetical protein
LDNTRRVIKLLFLGQCLNYGYSGVEKSSTFPALTASLLRSRFSSLNFQFENKYFYHPLGLKALLKHRLYLTKPDLVIINLPAMFAARSWRVSLLYEIAPEVVDTARSFIQKIDARLKQMPGGAKLDSFIEKAGSWDPTTVHPPLSIEAYERLVEEALEECRQTNFCKVILMGPGRFNEDTQEDYPVHSPGLWQSVNEMVMRIGEKMNLPVINAQAALTEYSGEVFLPCNHRFSAYGHEVVAREVESVVATQLAVVH